RFGLLAGLTDVQRSIASQDYVADRDRAVHRAVPGHALQVDLPAHAAGADITRSDAADQPAGARVISQRTRDRVDVDGALPRKDHAERGEQTAPAQSPAAAAAASVVAAADDGATHRPQSGSYRVALSV